MCKVQLGFIDVASSCAVPLQEVYIMACVDYCILTRNGLSKCFAGHPVINN
jgi:hypothetical protein